MIASAPKQQRLARRRYAWLWRVTPALALLSAIGFFLLGTRENRPRAPEISAFPARMGPFVMLRDESLDPAVRDTLAADALLNRTYRDPAAGRFADLLIAWYASQRGGESQPHSPQVCLPAGGWTPESSGEIAIQTAEGPIRVNRYLVRNGPERAVVLYWYQLMSRAVASEWTAKMWLMSDALFHRRSDEGLVRIVVWRGNGPAAQAEATAADFARAVYPAIATSLPR